MHKRQIPHRVSIERLRARAATCGASVGAAVLGIGIALVAMTALLLLLGALGVSSAPETLVSAGQDAIVAIYAVQLIGLSFFNDTAELRFAAVPGLLLVGLSVTFATAVAVRTRRGSSRRKMAVALATPVPYALLMGFTALFAPLHFTAPGFGVGIAVSPSPVEAFLLPLGWGLLFASLGGFIGIYGGDWRRAASRSLGDWAGPLNSSLCMLAVGLAASAALALIGVLTVVDGHLSSVTGGGLGDAIKLVGATIVALPTIAAAVFVSGFGIPFEWQVDALSHGQGSISALGGTLPSATEASQAQGPPGVIALAPLIAVGTVFALGWLSARRSGSDARLGLVNAVRVAALATMAVWLLALLGRVDAQVGGLLGFHLVPDPGALLWRVPLIVFLGCLAGSFAYALAQGASARRRLARALLGAGRPSSWGWSQPRWVSQGLTWRAALAVSFASVPVLLVGLGATGPATSAAPENLSLAPIEQAAEQRLERASTQDETVAVTVNPETRVVGTASVHTPLRALGIAPRQSRATKAEDVLVHYGELFGLSDPAAELGNAQASTDKFGVTHVSFTQMAHDLPVFGGGIGVHLSNKGELLDFVSGSLIPDVIVAEDTAKLATKAAIEGASSDDSPAREPRAGSEPPGLRRRRTVRLRPRCAARVVRLADRRERRKSPTEYVVDAVTGEILDTIPKSDQTRFREVYD